MSRFANGLFVDPNELYLYVGATTSSSSSIVTFHSMNIYMPECTSCPTGKYTESHGSSNCSSCEVDKIGGITFEILHIERSYNQKSNLGSGDVQECARLCYDYYLPCHIYFKLIMVAIVI